MSKGSPASNTYSIAPCVIACSAIFFLLSVYADVCWASPELTQEEVGLLCRGRLVQVLEGFALGRRAERVVGQQFNGSGTYRAEFQASTI